MACKRSAVRSRLPPPRCRIGCSQSPSSRGLGHHPFTVSTGVRIPLGTPSSFVVDVVCTDCLTLGLGPIEIQVVKTKVAQAAFIISAPGGYSSAGRALAWHARGQRFDPAYLHQQRRSDNDVVTVVPRSPSSRGLGHHPFTVSTGVRIPLGTPGYVEKPPRAAFFTSVCPGSGRAKVQTHACLWSRLYLCPT